MTSRVHDVRGDLALSVAFSGAILLLLLLLGIVLALPAHAGVRSPLTGKGDFSFIADLPVFPTPDGHRVDLSVRIDHRNVPVGRLPSGPVRASVRMKLAREGVVAVDTLQAFVLPDAPFRSAATAFDDESITFELLEIAAEVPAGPWAVTVEVTMSGSMRAAVSSVLFVPEDGDRELRVSDPEFRLTSGEFSLPHPERLYGVSQDTLEVYFEVMTDENLREKGEPVALQVEIEDPVYGGMDEQLIWIETSRSRQAQSYRLPLGSFPEGTYVLRLIPPAELAAPVEAGFVVSWRLDRATQLLSDVLLEAQLLLPAEDYERLKRMPRARQSQLMQAFWDERDPTQGTVNNELQERFLARVSYANRFYGEGLKRGALTDRGRTYIRYGAPAEVRVEVFPGSSKALEAAIERVHDPLAGALEPSLIADNTFGGGAPADLVPTSDSDFNKPPSFDAAKDLRRMDMSVSDTGSFELWSYDGDGAPLFDDFITWSESINLRFLFVDRNGTAKYSLDYSNIPARF